MTPTSNIPSSPLWWQSGVIYQVYPRSFKDTTGNGVGDLQGVIEKLDYLAGTLQVQAIWISPFFPSPMADFGYDVSDYTGIHPLFGTLADFDELLAKAHARGLKVIIDLVPNHTSDQHSWFLESRSSTGNPKHDWYIWRDARPDGSPPNNWLSVFGGSAWEWDEVRGQYYLHSFLKEQPDLNWRNPDLVAAMFGVARFWLERGVDGFRIDVAHYIMKDPEWRDNPVYDMPTPGAHKAMGEYDRQQHLYDKGHSDVHDVYRSFRRLLDEYSQEQPRLAIGEIHIFDLNRWVRYYGEDADELHMPFNFALLNVKWQAQQVRAVVNALEGVLKPENWPNYVLGNHDEARLASRIGLRAARVAAMLLLTLRGTPTIYYGDELGMEDVNVPPELEQDPWGKRVPGLSRDPARTPMQWNPGRHAGFSPPDTPQLWLPLADNYQQVNVETELAQPDSMLNLYRRLLSYRNASPVLQSGAYQAVDGIPDDVFAYLREVPDQPPVLVALNFSTQPQQVRLSDFGQGRAAVSTYMDREGPVNLHELTLRGEEGLVLELV